jgi:hypothetical protein
MADTVGSKSNATAARPAPASHAMRYGVRAIRRSGNMRRRSNAGRARKGDCDASPGYSQASRRARNPAREGLAPFAISP